MASKQILCEICFKENAVGYCQSCGDVGQNCVDIHKTGKMFQTHTVLLHEAVKMNEDGTENPNVILRDITEERCKQHPTEKAIFLCKVHDSTICGRCLHSGHRPCGEEVVDLLHEVVNIDCEKVNTMKSLLMEIKDEILLLKNKAKHSKENSKKNADKCVQECMGFENKIKKRVHELTSGIRDGITKKHNEHLTIYSHITKMCDEKTKWCRDLESKIDSFVDKNMAGHLYLMNRHFEKEVSEARSHLKEFKHKHTFKGFDFKENKVILKCVFEDLEEVCEHQEEVTGSDDGNANDVGASTTKINQTRRELTVLLSQIKLDLDQSEKARNALCDELKQVKQDKDNSEKKGQILEQELLKSKQGIEESEKTRKGFEQELLKAKQCIEKYEKTRRELTALLNQLKQDLDQSEKARKALCDELKQVKQDKDNSEKKRKIFEQELEKAKQDIDEFEKTRNALCDELKHVKKDKDYSETKRKILEQEVQKAEQDIEELKKGRNAFCDELKQVKQDKDNSEKKRNILEQELQKAKQGIEESEKTRKGFEQDLLKAKQCIEEYEKERAVLKKKIPHLKDFIKWTQPTGTFEVKFSQESFGPPVINLSFTFPDGIQTTHHSSPGKPYKGGTFTGRLLNFSEGQLLCRMLKAAFRRGLMFNLGKEGKVVLDGISLYDGPVFNGLFYCLQPAFIEYVHTVKAELAAKGITEMDIDQKAMLEETFTVDGSKSH